VTDFCRSCGAEIVWAETPKGRRMPVDAHPYPNGNLRLDNMEGRIVATVRKPEPGQRRYRPHFATCPQSSDWRR
jgi:hypothetical protein